MVWRLWRGRGRKRTHSRPRVARAAEAARSAQGEMNGVFGMGLGSARAGASLMLTGGSGAGGLSGAGRTGGVVLAASPAVLLASARVSNRTVEDVWEEALTVWTLTGNAARDVRPAGQTFERRHHVWHEIDQTLGALRAG
jgi:hypothetical protein